MEIKEIESKTILSKSKLPDADYVVNPYIGCRFGCVYCYASFMARYIGKNTEDWGDFVHVKVNAADLLEQELEKLSHNGSGIKVLLSSVTDPYQGLEAKYKITRDCLKVFADNNFQGNLSILTKSPLVLRDIDLLKKIKNVEVGMTVTSTDDSVSRFFEKNAPKVSTRYSALRKLIQEDIKTYAFVGPLLPTYVKNPESLETIFRKVAESGTTDIYVEHLNLSKYIYSRLKQELQNLSAEDLELFDKTRNKEYRYKLNVLVQEFVEKYNLDLRLDEAIYHNVSAD